MTSQLGFGQQARPGAQGKEHRQLSPSHAGRMMELRTSQGPMNTVRSEAPRDSTTKKMFQTGQTCTKPGQQQQKMVRFGMFIYVYVFFLTSLTSWILLPPDTSEAPGHVSRCSASPCVAKAPERDSGCPVPVPQDLSHWASSSAQCPSLSWTIKQVVWLW